MATVELKHVRKKYGQTEIIHGVDLDIKKGQFVVIVGPSGCGKSTLLRMVAGLEAVTSGEIIINGEVVNQLPPRARDIAMVFQNYALYPHMNVYDNMAYGLKMRGISRADIEVRVQKAAQMLRLEKLLQRKPRELSGGQRQRVAMGRAIVREPTLFLFDEPLSNLDAKLRVDMRLEIQKLQRALNITSLYVTHDQVEAMTLADILVVMNQGEIEQVGKPLHVYQKPASLFVAGFIGSPPMNFIEMEVCDEGSALLFGDHQAIPLPNNLLDAYEGRNIIVGIRPEVIQIAEPSDKRAITLRVDLVEILGSDTIVYGHLDHDKQALIVKLPGQIHTYAGEVLVVTFQVGHLHFFDKESGKRIIF